MEYPIRKVVFGDLNINDIFFESFKEDYPEYEDWFFRKRNDFVYVIIDAYKHIRALLKLKIEDETEDYSNIIPDFAPKKRLKICSFKVSLSSRSGVGKTFVEMILKSAKQNSVEEVYVTLYNKNGSKEALVRLLESNGFLYWGNKNSDELVYVLKR